ncbi:alpha/beta hydrolase [Psychrobium sp. MM17-31]|uniref:alpha/beta fold hydrolase n=1 Tax=Psychrobium sp. MM17-31 TaxID=2917758 RepID=UPI001EF3ED8B|nr:alpha/beta hydrolase [Psychrobium sp. MM17-31]MCG7533193.1 alpha/beta hydrolase [Psychrobium sp. MM17-31]
MAQQKQSNKPTLVFLPGTLCTRDVFTPIINSEHFNSVSVDVTTESSLSQTTELIKQHIGEQPVILVGFSMGGMIAFDFIRTYPHLVAGLCLINSNCHADLPGRKQTRDLHLAKSKSHGLESVLREHYLANYFSDVNNINAEIVVSMANQLGVEVFESQLSILANRPDSTEELSKFDRPTLIIGSQDDVPCPPLHQIFMAGIVKHSELHILNNSGHFALLEQPQQIKAIIEQWLEQTHESV